MWLLLRISFAHLPLQLLPTVLLVRYNSSQLRPPLLRLYSSRVSAARTHTPLHRPLQLLDELLNLRNWLLHSPLFLHCLLQLSSLIMLLCVHLLNLQRSNLDLGDSWRWYEHGWGGGVLGGIWRWGEQG